MPSFTSSCCRALSRLRNRLNPAEPKINETNGPNDKSNPLLSSDENNTTTTDPSTNHDFPRSASQSIVIDYPKTNGSDDEVISDDDEDHSHVRGVSQSPPKKISEKKRMFILDGSYQQPLNPGARKDVTKRPR